MDIPLDSSTDAFTEAGFRARAREGLLPAPSPAIFDPRTGRALGPSDWDLNPEFKDDLAVMAPPRPAAVLVPIVLRDPLTVLLTQRSHDMPSHPGQISFPGGKMEAFDATPVACALRETREEIGVTPEFVETLGFLDSYRTGTGFQISPVVGFVRPGFAIALDPREVLEVFEVPLALPDADGQPPEAHARLARPAAVLLCHALRGPLHLGGHRGNAQEPAAEAVLV